MAATGDLEKAREVQEDFSRKCPVISHSQALVELSLGNRKAAAETIYVSNAVLLKVADGLPVVGHAKGIVHYALRDAEKGNECMIRPNRSVVGVAVGAATAADVMFCAGTVHLVLFAEAPVARLGGYDVVATVVNSCARKKYAPVEAVKSVTDFATGKGTIEAVTSFFLGQAIVTGLGIHHIEAVAHSPAVEVLQNHNADQVQCTTDNWYTTQTKNLSIYLVYTIRFIPVSLPSLGHSLHYTPVSKYAHL